MKRSRKVFSLKPFWPKDGRVARSVNSVVVEFEGQFPSLNRDNLTKAYDGTLARASAGTVLDLIGLASHWAGRAVDPQEIVIERRK